MHRRLLEIPLPGGHYLPIYSYGAMLVVGFLTGIWLARRRAEAEGLDPEIFTDMGVRAMIAGVLGARLFFVVENWRDYWPQVHRVLFIQEGGLVFYGGLLAVLAVLGHYIAKRRLPAAKLLDIAAPSLAIGLTFGRIGCFLNGCCFGDRCSPNMPFAVRFPKVIHHGVLEGSPVYLHHLANGWVTQADNYSLPVHPTQLYSSACAFLSFLFLNWYYPKRRREGDVALLWLMIYPCYRFVIEWLRDDNPPWITGLTPSQNVSVLVFAAAAVVWIRRHRRAPDSERGGKKPRAG